MKANALFVEATRQSIAKRGEIHREVADIMVRHSQLLAQLKRDQEAKQLADALKRSIARLIDRSPRLPTSRQPRKPPHLSVAPPLSVRMATSTERL